MTEPAALEALPLQYFQRIEDQPVIRERGGTRGSGISFPFSLSFYIRDQAADVRD